jgi:hypothetical protein
MEEEAFIERYPQKVVIGFEKLVFTIKSIIAIAFVVALCGVAGAVLFGPELKLQEGWSDRSYVASLPLQIEQKWKSIHWRELATPANIEHIAQVCALASATPEGMTFVVVFYIFKRISGGGSVSVAEIGSEIRTVFSRVPDRF